MDMGATYSVLPSFSGTLTPSQISVMGVDGVEVSHTCGLTREGEIDRDGGGVGFSNSRRIREEEGVGFRVTWRVVPSSWRRSLLEAGQGRRV